MRSPIALTVALLLLAGCNDRKQPEFAECHRIFSADKTAPERLVMKSIDLCMQGHGYKRDEAACGSVAALTPACYSPNWPWYLFHVFG